MGLQPLGNPGRPNWLQVTSSSEELRRIKGDVGKIREVETRRGMGGGRFLWQKLSLRTGKHMHSSI